MSEASSSLGPLFEWVMFVSAIGLMGVAIMYLAGIAIVRRWPISRGLIVISIVVFLFASPDNALRAIAGLTYPSPEWFVASQVLGAAKVLVMIPFIYYLDRAAREVHDEKEAVSEE